MNEFLSEDEIEEIVKFNRQIVRFRGEPFDVDREKLTEIFQSVNNDFDAQYYPNKRIRIVKKVSVIIGRIAWEQPFTEGNKETCLGVGVMFLRRNGFTLPLKQTKIDVYKLLNKTIMKFENDPTIISEVESFLNKYVV